MTGQNSAANDLLRGARERTPSASSSGDCLTRAELADLLNAWILEHADRQVDIDANYIGKLERGQIRWPQETYRTALRETLGVARDADLGFRRPRRATRRSDTSAVDRKEFLQVALGAGAALIATHPLTELAQAFVAPEVPSSVGRPDIDDLWAATHLLDSWDNSRGGGMADAAIRAQLRYTADLLQTRCTPALRPELFSAAGTLLSVAGFMSFDTFQLAEASRRFAFALACAQESADWHLRAIVLSSMARQAFWTDDFDTSLTLVELAQVRSEHLTGTERSMLSSLQARALARLGRVQEAASAIGSSDDEFAAADPNEDPFSIQYYDAAEHAGETGHGLADLAEQGHFVTEARTRLAGAITSHGDMYARARTLCQLRLATLEMNTGDPRTAASIAGPAVDNLVSINSRRVDLIAGSLRTAATRHHSVRDVVELDERLRLAEAG